MQWATVSCNPVRCWALLTSLLDQRRARSAQAKVEQHFADDEVSPIVGSFLHQRHRIDLHTARRRRLPLGIRFILSRRSPLNSLLMSIYTSALHRTILRRVLLCTLLRHRQFRVTIYTSGLPGRTKTPSAGYDQSLNSLHGMGARCLEW